MTSHIDQDTLLFFERHREVYPLYRAFVSLLLQRFPETMMKVQKTQITFYHRYTFACVSFLRVKRKAELPDAYFVLTLSLPRPLDSWRVAAKTEAYPGRWTQHILIREESDLDAEVFGWIKEAYDFSERK